MTTFGPIFELVDATGGGACRLRPDGGIEAISPGFAALCAASGEVTGRQASELLAELPALDSLGPRVSADAEVFRAVGSDGVGRELSAARIEDPEGAWLVLVDRSGEARLRRTRDRLGRQIDDLKAELAARERAPRRAQVRSMVDLARRLDEALARARRYQHPVSVIAIAVDLGQLPDPQLSTKIGETILASIRGVDDLGRVDAGHWVLLLPHTPLAGAEVVGKRIQERLAALQVQAPGLGVAQAGREEAGSAVVERADQACSQAREGGGGMLLAVALV
ncbi:hypothetical protein G6O69_12590 [Pseudenhygromyxa sp. WMMC2535]|uniref:GGDEF domain-containing protein n=1 Tax=Pseudenhygromyxa sp. WMMC2535 TaxID=2712867 RepID=UPI0015544C8A|nr:hypothetical protein [Pseudenhygromyxa sp. WMMC2535]NVB38671.1 hypothetical protein [Pseudenhygromyxa sp. WMMC2535]